MSEELNEKKALRDLVEQNINSINVKTKEFIVTIILSLATLLSAWCGYQSNIWDDIEKASNGERNLILKDEAKNTLAGYQLRAAHSNLAIRITESFKKGDTEMYEFFMDRADTVLRNAIEEWISLDPLNNPNAPRSPLNMDSYKLSFEQQNEELRKLSDDLQVKAKDANATSDGYLSMTVLLATVLFFTGIAGTLKSRRSQILSLTVSMIIFIISIVMLIGLPIGKS